MRLIPTRIVLSILGAILFIGCSDDDSQTPHYASLENTTWNLSSIVLSGVILPAANGQELTFRLESGDDDENIFKATADCNQCGGHYSLGVPDSISISMGCTEMYCGDESQGEFFSDALGSAATYDFHHASLLIFFSSQEMIGTLVFDADND